MWRRAAGALWPRTGWARAFSYVRHRLTRLPDDPARIARGVACGVFTTFTPLFGLHFGLSVLLAWMLRGNVVAALLGTFFGNPLTYVPIAVVSLQFGHFLLGTEFRGTVDGNVFTKFAAAGSDLSGNLWAVLRGERADWSATEVFWHDVFWPWTVGGVLPGLVAAIAAYALCLPLIRAYQARRRRMAPRRPGPAAARRMASSDGEGKG